MRNDGRSTAGAGGGPPPRRADGQHPPACHRRPRSSPRATTPPAPAGTWTGRCGSCRAPRRFRGWRSRPGSSSRGPGGPSGTVPSADCCCRRPGVRSRGSATRGSSPACSRARSAPSSARWAARARSANPSRAPSAGCSSSSHAPVARGGRRGAPYLEEHGQGPPQVHLPQARCGPALRSRGGRATPRSSRRPALIAHRG